MLLTQESVLNLLLAQGGKVKKSDLVGTFKGSIDCDDPAQRQRNRELFKTFVNNVAFVREIDGVRYVVVRRQHQRPADASVEQEEEEEEDERKSGEKDALRTGELQQQQQQQQQRPPARAQVTGSSDDEGRKDKDPEQAGDSPTELSPLQLALQRSQFKSVKVKRVLNFEVQRDANAAPAAAPAAQSKPYALPLRMAPATKLEVRKLKAEPDEPPESPKPDAPGHKRRPTCVERGARVPEESREGPTFPLEQSEHEWLVRCASGHWSQVYGLLLGDNQLADKRDFMSGFTVLHWAAKCGNSKMLEKIMDVSRRGGVEVDVNARAHGGYTPLHIAALHDQEYILAMLVGEYGADASVRDNCGKRAYHYLHKGVSPTLREMLAGPKARHEPSGPPPEKEEPDLLPDLPKGLHSISRLFQPHATGHKKKHKQRPGFYSLSDEHGEEREDGGGGGGSFRYRLSDVFM